MKNIITDLDGTLCIEMQRRHLIASHGWEEYFKDLISDPVNVSVAKMLKDLRIHGYNIYIFTSRPEQYREETEQWLNLHDVPYDAMEMRAAADTNLESGDWQAKRTDEDIKMTMLEKYDLNHQNTLMVLEDRDAMVEFYRLLGFNCWQVHHEGKLFTAK